MAVFRFRSAFLMGLCLVPAVACSSAQPGTDADTDVLLEPGVPVELKLGPQAAADEIALNAALKEVESLDRSAFLERAKVPFEAITYDPLQSLGLDLIQSSSVQLDEAELAGLKEHGFVISTRQEFPTFTYGYASIYADDLPLFVSADSILYALHQSYGELLKSLEQESLSPKLGQLLSALRARLAEAEFSAQVRQDVDLFLSVGLSLLQDQVVAPRDGSLRGKVEALLRGCKKAEGSELVELFGAKRRIDFSQCKPRGHYTDSEALSRYFRAMMWLGRIDLRMIETQEDGSSLFHRRQLESTLAFHDLLTPEILENYRAIDQVVSAFVGEHDYMTLDQVGQLKKDLRIKELTELDSRSDGELAQAIVQGGYGTQRISSHYMVNGVGSGTLPLSSSFALLGQRYVIDSHVFSNVVYDRVKRGAVARMMPNPLDVAYAALDNDQAGLLLDSELGQYDYASDLAKTRVLVDFEGEEYWSKNLYNSWLGALRALSPAQALTESERETLPGIARSEAWGRRLLNTQLASWAELRHDTILYVKQSYSTGAACEFPDAYVEPYPEFFARIEGFAEQVLGLLTELPIQARERAQAHFQHFSKVTRTLREMAEHQRTGTPHSAAHLDFINEAVQVEEICGGAFGTGWYPKLFYRSSSTDFDPTIADVHTQPTDEGGNEVGRVLHVGTGNARLFVTTIETCEGPRAYAGLVSSYHELVTEKFERLDDPAWEARLQEGKVPAAPTWVQPILVESP